MGVVGGWGTLTYRYVPCCCPEQILTLWGAGYPYWILIQTAGQLSLSPVHPTNSGTKVNLKHAHSAGNIEGQHKLIFATGGCFSWEESVLYAIFCEGSSLLTINCLGQSCGDKVFSLTAQSWTNKALEYRIFRYLELRHNEVSINDYDKFIIIMHSLFQFSNNLFRNMWETCKQPGSF